MGPYKNKQKQNPTIGHAVFGEEVGNQYLLTDL
jgi:hypothetical protein